MNNGGQRHRNGNNNNNTDPTYYYNNNNNNNTDIGIGISVCILLLLYFGRYRRRPPEGTAFRPTAGAGAGGDFLLETMGAHSDVLYVRGER